MNILMQNRDPELWQGGDMIQLQSSLLSLRKKGINVDFNSQALVSNPLMLRLYDVIHLFNFSMGWTKYQLWAAKKQNRKVIISMIYHQSEQFIPYRQQQIMIDSADKLIFLNEGEVERARKNLKIPDEKIVIIPNGIDDFWFQDLKSDNEEKFVLTVGRIEQSKGQLATAKACKELGIKYIMVGEPTSPKYLKECKKEGAIYNPPLEPKDLIKMYASCSVFALASRSEVMSLACMEAMAQNCNVVLTDHSEWKPKGISYCEFDNVESIKKAIKRELKREKTDKRKTIKKYTWDKVADDLIKVYESFTDN